MQNNLPRSIDDTLDLLARGRYVADRALATVIFLALKMGRPLFLEGEAGVGKTEIAKVLAQSLGRNLIRLQCYEGLDVNSGTTGQESIYDAKGFRFVKYDLAGGVKVSALLFSKMPKKS